MDDYKLMRIDAMEAIWRGGFKRARAALGVTAFGLSVSDLPAGFDGVPPHVHTFDGQEEIYFALAGGGWLEVAGERVELTPEIFVRVGPTATRRPIAGPDGLRLLAAGGVPGAAYEPFFNSQAGAPEPPVAELPGVRAAAGHASSRDFRAVALSEVEALSGHFAGVTMYPLRRALGVTAFGVNLFDIERSPDGEDGSAYPRHDHLKDGQEEVYAVVAGTGELELGGERLPVARGEMARVGPAVRRKFFPSGDGLRVLALGAPPGAPYEPPARTSG